MNHSGHSSYRITEIDRSKVKVDSSPIHPQNVLEPYKFQLIRDI